MLVAEAYQHRVAVVIAGTPVPAARGLSRAELYVAKWHIGTEKHVAVTARTDTGIHKTGVVTIGGSCRQAEHRQQGNAQ